MSSSVSGGQSTPSPKRKSSEPLSIVIEESYRSPPSSQQDIASHITKDSKVVTDTLGDMENQSTSSRSPRCKFSYKSLVESFQSRQGIPIESPRSDISFGKSHFIDVEDDSFPRQVNEVDIDKSHGFPDVDQDYSPINVGTHSELHDLSPNSMKNCIESAHSAAYPTYGYPFANAPQENYTTSYEEDTFPEWIIPPSGGFSSDVWKQMQKWIGKDNAMSTYEEYADTANGSNENGYTINSPMLVSTRLSLPFNVVARWRSGSLAWQNVWNPSWRATLIQRVFRAYIARKKSTHFEQWKEYAIDQRESLATIGYLINEHDEEFGWSQDDIGALGKRIVEEAKRFLSTLLQQARRHLLEANKRIEWLCDEAAIAYSESGNSEESPQYNQFVLLQKQQKEEVSRAMALQDQLLQEIEDKEQYLRSVISQVKNGTEIITAVQNAAYRDRSKSASYQTASSELKFTDISSRRNSAKQHSDPQFSPIAGSNIPGRCMPWEKRKPKTSEGSLPPWKPCSPSTPTVATNNSGQGLSSLSEYRETWSPSNSHNGTDGGNGTCSRTGKAKRKIKLRKKLQSVIRRLVDEFRQRSTDLEEQNEALKELVSSLFPDSKRSGEDYDNNTGGFNRDPGLRQNLVYDIQELRKLAGPSSDSHTRDRLLDDIDSIMSASKQ